MGLRIHLCVDKQEYRGVVLREAADLIQKRLVNTMGSKPGDEYGDAIRFALDTAIRLLREEAR